MTKTVLALDFHKNLGHPVAVTVEVLEGIANPTNRSVKNLFLDPEVRIRQNPHAALLIVAPVTATDRIRTAHLAGVH